MKLSDKILIATIAIVCVAFIGYSVINLVRVADRYDKAAKATLVEQGFKKGFDEGVTHAIVCLDAQRDGYNMLAYKDGQCVHVVLRMDFGR